MGEGVSMSGERYVSTGLMPDRDAVARLLDQAYVQFGGNSEGSLSQVYPALASADPTRLGICVAAVDGAVVETGDARVRFPVMSVAKPFVFALVAETNGVDEVRRLIGVNATGLPFNSVSAVEREPTGRTNPMVNAGAIATTSLVAGSDVEHRWSTLRDGLSAFAGRELDVDEDVLGSALETNHRNRSIAALLASAGALAGSATEATELYTRQSCLSVTAVDLALMGATLADGGVHPVSRRRVVSDDVARATLAVMTIAGLYETSGDWLFDVGVPGKSGIGGGIVSVSPGKGGLGTYAPLLDAAGNSVKGQLVTASLTRALGLDILASRPA